MQQYVEKWIEVAGQKDKDYVLAKILSDGWPQFLGESKVRSVTFWGDKRMEAVV